MVEPRSTQASAPRDGSRPVVPCRHRLAPRPLLALAPLIAALLIPWPWPPTLSGAALAQGLGGSGFRATVLSVGDGDTLRVSREGREGPPITIRLACIDAPEMAQRPYGAASRASLQSRLPRGRVVTVVPHDRDRYGRTVAELISGININLAMLEDGQAFVYRRYLGHCDGRAFLQAEERASHRRAGVWQVPGGLTRPWDFRRGHRRAPIHDGTTGDGQRWSCGEIGSRARAQQLHDQGHTYLDGNGDGQACETLP